MASAWMNVSDEASGNTELLTTRVMMCACTRVPVYNQEGSMLQYGDMYYSIMRLNHAIKEYFYHHIVGNFCERKALVDFTVVNLTFSQQI